MRTTGSTRLALPCAAVALLLVVAGVVLALTRPEGAGSGPGADFGFAVAFAGLAAAGVAAALAAPRSPVGLVLGLGSLLFALPVVAGEYALHALPGGRGWPGGEAAAWLSAWPPPLAYAVLAVALPLAFPDGRLSRIGRVLLPVALAACSLGALGLMVKPGRLDGLLEIDNPYALDPVGEVARVVAAAAPPLLLLAALVALGDLLLRGVRARGEKRAQFQLLGLALALVVATTTARLLLDGSGLSGWLVPALGLLSFLAVPTALAVAMTRYRLYDVGRLIDRALVYALVSSGVVGLYVTAVALLGGALGRDVDLGASVIAATVAAVLYPLLREGAQALVSRRIYGWRDDPYPVLSALASRLQVRSSDQALADAVTGLARALRLPWVAVHDSAGALRAAAGTPPAEPGRVTSIALRAQGLTVGRLEVGSRHRESSLGERDRAVLTDAAAALAAAVHTIDLTEDLRASRERLVRAREEERRRLRRDLHDGLGPVLTGVVLGLDGIASMVPSDPERALALAAKVGADARDAVDEVRRVVHDLRPPALDQLGLVSALEQRASALSSDQLRIVVRASELSALPAAVEVACYAVAVEAMTNAVRHSDATTCDVVLSVDNELHLVVTDDGHGEHGPAGVGTASSRERADELGGSVSVSATPGSGTVLRMSIPLEQAPC